MARNKFRLQYSAPSSIPPYWRTAVRKAALAALEGIPARVQRSLLLPGTYTLNLSIVGDTAIHQASDGRMLQAGEDLALLFKALEQLTGAGPGD